MKKLILIILVLFTYSCDLVRDLKKETFGCSGKGAGGTVGASFAIDPSSRTLTFIQDGDLMGSMINYPSKIRYEIKSSSGDEILTQDKTISTVSSNGRNMKFISYIKKNILVNTCRKTKTYEISSTFFFFIVLIICGIKVARRVAAAR